MTNSYPTTANELTECISRLAITGPNSFSLSNAIVNGLNNSTNNPFPTQDMPLVEGLVSTLYPWAYAQRYDEAAWLNSYHQQQHASAQPLVGTGRMAAAHTASLIANSDTDPAGRTLNPDDIPASATYEQTPPPIPAAAESGISPYQFVAALSQANHSRNRLNGGWVVYHIDQQGQLSVQKGERYHLLGAGTFVPLSRASGQPQIGDHVAIVATKESTTLQPEFYYSFSNTPFVTSDYPDIVRFYFNALPQGAIQLVDLLSRDLNQYRIPYRFKCLIDPQHYQRRDAAVLYINRNHFPLVFQLIRDGYDSLKAALKDDVPLFSKRLMAGVGLAEDPGNGESFGMHRMRLVARALVDAWQQGKHDLPSRMTTIERQFSEAGYSLATPYLNPRSPDRYVNQMVDGLLLEGTQQ